MLTLLIIFVIPNLVVCAGLALLWRTRAAQKRAHLLVALPLAALVWFASWLFGLWLYLDILKAGVAGDVAGKGLFWSLVPAIAVFSALRKTEPIKTNEA